MRRSGGLFRRERDPGGTPGREDAVRPRLDDRSDESMRSGDEVDAAWHEQKEVPYVNASKTSEVEGVLFDEDIEAGAAAAGRQRRGK